MNKQELINKYKELENGTFDIGALVVCQSILKDLEQLDEPQKVVVPQFVADWYEECKDNLEYNLWSYIYNWGIKEKCDFKNWLDLGRNNPIQTLINMHQFGYEVEKENRYIVKLKNVPDHFGILNFGKHSKEWLFSDSNTNSHHRTKHTRKQLEEADFGWVFDCEGIEVKEVEE